ncbi:hypothetical protein SAMN05216270_107155 [Glycomyces harbinensis]|uniref:Uncharacterized protein n=2 Tax=Glycomyces harbinensis TaxID=58114 RepID=A0A1G6XFX0_9ACTN|nr:hypothetical protein SAMN05216270_107155 [Glycomyces harbinensis]
MAGTAAAAGVGATTEQDPLAALEGWLEYYRLSFGPDVVEGVRDLLIAGRRSPVDAGHLSDPGAIIGLHSAAVPRSKKRRHRSKGVLA